ncbi:MAG: helix-turn-helix domain-containing protein [Ignavibacteriae bacterium]|nr:helix-turn-helix domain-containing protein [Ignavibacteriota bacterium]
MNFKETCDFLGIHPSTLNKWKANNKIPYKRLGKRIFFQREEILNSLKSSNYYKIKIDYSQYN